MVLVIIKNKLMAGIEKIRVSLLRHWFNWRCRGILEARPATITKDGKFVLLTMTCHRDLIQYLVAIKSFTQQAIPRKVFVLDDGSLTGKDIRILKSHVPGIEILVQSNFNSDVCPHGGCWERLLAIAELAKHDFVVQMDADTLTCGPIDEVLECVNRMASFVLSTAPPFRSIEPMRVRNEQVKEEQKRLLNKGIVATHIQFLAELNFDSIKRFNRLKYIRGCAGFSGFAKGSIEKGFIEEISSQMQDAIGDKWCEWGSEQVMSNIVVANSEDAVVLPHPRFSNCSEMDPQETHFMHFIGMCRFTGTQYIRSASKVIDSLMQR